MLLDRDLLRDLKHRLEHVQHRAALDRGSPAARLRDTFRVIAAIPSHERVSADLNRVMGDLATSLALREGDGRKVYRFPATGTYVIASLDVPEEEWNVTRDRPRRQVHIREAVPQPDRYADSSMDVGTIESYIVSKQHANLIRAASNLGSDDLAGKIGRELQAVAEHMSDLNQLSSLIRDRHYLRALPKAGDLAKKMGARRGTSSSTTLLVLHSTPDTPKGLSSLLSRVSIPRRGSRLHTPV